MIMLLEKGAGFHFYRAVYRAPANPELSRRVGYHGNLLRERLPKLLHRDTGEDMSDAPDWKRLSQALTGLHRSLIQHARRDYERDHGPISSPAQFLRLLTNDRFFAWLRTLSELIVNIDAAGEFDEGAKEKV